MTDTPNLALPYILAAQSQKHVTHNEAIRALDCLVQIAVLDRDLATPPSAPDEGARYIVAASATGAWTGATGKLAAFQDGAWEIYTPNEGWLAWITDENALVVYDGAGWSSVSSSGGGGTGDHGLLTGLGDDDHPHYHNDARGDARYTPIAPSTLGINATADTTNRLSINSAASLFNNIGNGHQIKINKAAAGDTASFLFQTGFSGRAEIGTTGDDDFRFKVSPDGSTFHDAIVIDRNNGRVAFPKSSYREVLTANRTYYVRTDGNNANTGLVNNSGGAFLTIQKAVDVAASVDNAGFEITIFINTGSWTTAVTFRPILGSGRITLRGINANDDDTVLTALSGHALFKCVTGFTGIYKLDYMKMIGSGSGATVDIFGGGTVAMGTVDFGANATQAQLQIGALSYGVFESNYAVSGGAGIHMAAYDAGHIRCQDRTVTVSGTPAFGTFAVADRTGTILANGTTYSGSATGARYTANRAGGILRNLASDSTAFVGNANGVATSPGWVI
jgi:hypothetical protein